MGFLELGQQRIFVQVPIESPTNAPPWPLAMVEQAENDLIEATEDSYKDEEHIPPPQDEDEDEGDAGDDTEERQGGAD